MKMPTHNVFNSSPSSGKKPLDLKNLIAAVIIVFILLGVLYYNFVLSAQLQKVEDLQTQIESQYQALRIKDIEFKNLENNQKEINTIEQQISFMERKLAQYPNKPDTIVFFHKMAQLYDLNITSVVFDELNQVEITALDPSEKQPIIYEIPFKVELVGTYENVRLMLEQFRQSQRFFYFRRLSLSNDKKEEGKSDTSFKNTRNTKNNLSVTLDFSIYSLESKDTSIERNYLYYNFEKYKKSTHDPFDISPTTLDFLSDEDLNIPPSDVPVPTQPQGSPKQSFDISVGSMYASGDIYYVAFRDQDKPENNTILQSSTPKPAKATLHISTTGYRYTLQVEGEPEQVKEVQRSIQNCPITIRSTIKKIEQDEQIKLQLYIQNTTTQPIVIQKTGSFLERITIYDINGIQIPSGKTINNITVTE